MAATARKRSCLQIGNLAAALLILLSFRWPLAARPAEDARARISYVATSLTSGNASDAMTPFDESYANYEKLKGYFLGLSSLDVANELDVTDEQDSETGADLTITWTLTLTDRSATHTERRTADLHVHLVLRNGKWKIVDFGPIEIFNPLQKQAPKR